jgi:type IV pilus assembly protein PilB
VILDRPIGEIFVESGFVSKAELDNILATREDTTEPLGSLLVRLNRLSVKDRLRCEAIQMGLPFVDLAQFEVDPDCSRIIPHAMAMRLLAVPIERTEVAASVAMANPLDLTAIDELAEATGLEIDPYLCSEEDVRDAIFRSFGAYDDLGELVGHAIMGGEENLHTEVAEEDDSVNVIELKEVIEGAPIVKLANAMMARAISMRASDIHVEPHARKVRIRLRIDGMLQEIMVIPKDLQHALTSRIKILAGLDIAERRAPQDGRCTLVSPQGEYDFRVSTYPSVHGETVVIRILDKHAATIDISKLGMSATNLERLLGRLSEPQGLVVVTGPTGSGKTTTLYAALNHLNAIHRNIITIEDPVEYQLDGVTQANVNPRAGLTFASGLRSMLRQDPDVILVGEVRDGETAGTAVEAALTGHLVLTSLHANDSAAALTRLLDIGVESSLLASSIACSVAQRLVRVVCPKCVETYEPEPQLLQRVGLPDATGLVRGRGCEHCAKTGFRGRTAIYEVLAIDSDVRRMMLKGHHASEIHAEAERNGLTTLRADGRRKVLEGLTTVEEVLRATAES